MDPRRPTRTRKGSRHQSGIPTRMPSVRPDSARGLKIRGVVVATYVVDAENHPRKNDPSSDTKKSPEGPKTIYCDVITYSSISGFRYRFLPQCVVQQDRGGLHSGRVWKPRAATISVSSGDLDVKYTDPASMDGDHVVIGFLDDSFSLPIIEGAISHPNIDLGNEESTKGNRLNLKLADGDPDFWKHHGAFYGVDDNGDFVVDTTNAYAGNDLESDGKEPANPGDGSAGNYVVNLPAGTALTIQVDGGDSFKVELKEGNAILTLGDGTKSGVIFEALQTWWDTTLKALFILFDAHVHGSGVGPTGPPVPTLNFPDLSTSIKSTKLKIPDL